MNLPRSYIKKCIELCYGRILSFVFVIELPMMKWDLILAKIEHTRYFVLAAHANHKTT